MTQLSSVIPLFPLSNSILIPGCNLPLQLFEPRYLQMFEDLTQTRRHIGIIQPRSNKGSDHPELFTVGTVGEVIESSNLPNRRYAIVLKGVRRFVIDHEVPDPSKLYRQAEVCYDEYVLDPSTEDVYFDHDEFFMLLENFIRIKSIKIQLKNIKMIRNFQIINLLSQVLPFSVVEKQALLEAKTHHQRMEKLITLMSMETQGFGKVSSDDDSSMIN